MRFGKTLRDSIYQPWRAAYIDYGKLKMLLRDDEGAGSDTEGGEMEWSEEDENRFCEEIFNVQLEKVASFHETQAAKLRERADAVFAKLRELTPTGEHGGNAKSDEGKGKEKETGETTAQRVREIEAELDSITAELRQLKRFSTINYTGFLKIVKKHDRKRGSHYRIRPMMQVRLASRPFNSEAGYSPLLAKLSIMYEAVHQSLNPDDAALPVDLATQQETRNNGERYLASKFWVHSDNLLEVKTMVLRHLPALVYSDSSAKAADATMDPPLTSLYFDSGKFDLYKSKLDHTGEATSLRLRWYGQLLAKPELFLDLKSVHKDGTSEERRIAIKDKYVKAFIDGEYKMEKTVQKMERQGESADAIAAFRASADAIQALVTSGRLEPVLRASYTRTAYQKPADDRVRVSIDSNLAFIREDNFDRRHPCRDPAEWHRRDIDARGATYPFAELPPRDVSRFPHAVLEIKVREDGTGRKRPEWVDELMSSHLVHPVPHFSKFIHGTAVLFDDYVNQLPFWLSDLETDIRRDPQEAFAKEEERRARRAADEQAVGSLLGTTAKAGSYKPARSSPAAKSASYLAGRMASEASATHLQLAQSAAHAAAEQSNSNSGNNSNDRNGNGNASTTYGTISSVLPGFSASKYQQWLRAKQGQSVELPEGVTEPAEWLKNDGPLRIEPKVWLANERTFFKWQHICVLLAGMGSALYAAGGGNSVASTMGVVYTLISVFIGFWGWFMMKTRRDMIIARSGRDFDNMIGPVVVSLALCVALVMNLVFSYRAAFERWAEHDVPSINVTVA